MIVFQLRHENVSNCELSSSDLPAQRSKAAERAMPNGRSKWSGHWAAFRQPRLLLACPATNATTTICIVIG
jgi:hypothetical protein